VTLGVPSLGMKKGSCSGKRDLHESGEAMGGRKADEGVEAVRSREFPSRPAKKEDDSLSTDLRGELGPGEESRSFDIVGTLSSEPLADLDLEAGRREAGAPGALKRD